MMWTNWALLLVALALLVSRSVESRRSLLDPTTTTSFPNYECQSNPGLSPFKLEGSYSTSPSANGMRVCFTGAPLQPCPASNRCCSQADFYKLELRVRSVCRHAIRSVTVNGVPTPFPTFELYGPGKTLALYKMPKLNLTTANVTGAKICITLKDPCPNMAALCPEGDGSCTYAIGQSGSCKCCPVNRLALAPPPPPPSPLPPPPSPSPPPPSPSPPPPSPSPPPPSPSPPPPEEKTIHYPPPTGGFPFCKCDKAPRSMPFTLAGAPVASRSASGQNLYCFTLAASPCANASSPCCSSSLLKVEWWSFDTCRGSVRAYIDSIQYPVTWDQDGTFRLTKLNYAPADVSAKPKQMCIELRKDGPCPTIDRFCRGGNCVYSLFNTDKDCCPTQTTPEAR